MPINLKEGEGAVPGDENKKNQGSRGTQKKDDFNIIEDWLPPLELSDEEVTQFLMAGLSPIDGMPLVPDFDGSDFDREVFDPDMRFFYHAPFSRLIDAFTEWSVLTNKAKRLSEQSQFKPLDRDTYQRVMHQLNQSVLEYFLISEADTIETVLDETGNDTLKITPSFMLDYKVFPGSKPGIIVSELQASLLDEWFGTTLIPLDPEDAEYKELALGSTPPPAFLAEVSITDDNGDIVEIIQDVRISFQMVRPRNKAHVGVSQNLADRVGNNTLELISVYNDTRKLDMPSWPDDDNNEFKNDETNGESGSDPSSTQT